MVAEIAAMFLFFGVPDRDEAVAAANGQPSGALMVSQVGLIESTWRMFLSSDGPRFACSAAAHTPKSDLMLSIQEHEFGPAASVARDDSMFGVGQGIGVEKAVPWDIEETHRIPGQDGKRAPIKAEGKIQRILGRGGQLPEESEMMCITKDHAVRRGRRARWLNGGEQVSRSRPVESPQPGEVDGEWLSAGESRIPRQDLLVRPCREEGPILWSQHQRVHVVVVPQQRALE
jgi:hypothetical protein